MIDGKQPTEAKQAITDDALIGQVRSAVDARVPPGEIEAFVGQQAMVNTFTGFPIEELRRIHLIPDPKHPEHTLELDSAEAVVYFRRPVVSEDPKVVGVQYRRGGSAALFFGIVLPP